MKWYYLDTGFNSGQYNMDFDLSLAKNCREDEIYFRLYRWKPFCISLGANQNFNSVDLEKAEGINIDVVKRPTGGKAILHSEELTYSIIFPLVKISSLRSFYCEINKALRKGLILYDDKLNEVDLESEQPDLRNFYKKRASEICFAVSARSEIQFRDKKLVGSAQRKINSSILQHGSILCGNYHKKIIEFLKLTDDDLISAQKQMLTKTIELENILGVKTDYEKLKNCLIKSFERYFNIKFENTASEVFSF